MKILTRPPHHPLYRLAHPAKRLVSSYFGAGVFHFLWLVTFLTIGGKPPRGFVGGLLWCLAPVVTAVGFSYGIIVYDLISLRIRRTLFSVLPWPLAGCVVGGAAIFPFGPMFIGVVMFLLGGVTVVLREAYLSRKSKRTSVPRFSASRH